MSTQFSASSCFVGIVLMHNLASSELHLANSDPDIIQ